MHDGIQTTTFDYIDCIDWFSSINCEIQSRVTTTMMVVVLVVMTMMMTDGRRNVAFTARFYQKWRSTRMPGRSSPQWVRSSSPLIARSSGVPSTSKPSLKDSKSASTSILCILDWLSLRRFMYVFVCVYMYVRTYAFKRMFIVNFDPFTTCKEFLEICW